jgi:hypothetical protein
VTHSFRPLMCYWEAISEVLDFYFSVVIGTALFVFTSRPSVSFAAEKPTCTESDHVPYHFPSTSQYHQLSFQTDVIVRLVLILQNMSSMFPSRLLLITFLSSFQLRKRYGKHYSCHTAPSVGSGELSESPAKHGDFFFTFDSSQHIFVRPVGQFWLALKTCYLEVQAMPAIA